MDINAASPAAVRVLLDRHSIAPLKRYGQNYLIDGNIADKIAQAAAPGGADVLEVGAGLGALTQRLASRAKRVVAYEIDSGLVRALGESLKGFNNATVVHMDFLKADIESEIPRLLGGDIYVAANLPYYITTDCIMKLLTARLNIKSITAMVQKEFAERLKSKPGGEGYGALSAAAGFFADIKVLFDVSSSCFFPKPDVSSAVIKLDLKCVDFDVADMYLKTIRGLFAAKRKTVKSNLRSSFSLGAQDAIAVLKGVGIDENARAENLSVIDFLKLSENIKKYINF